MQLIGKELDHDSRIRLRIAAQEASLPQPVDHLDEVDDAFCFAIRAIESPQNRYLFH
jgi:hypothetical protein